MTDQTNIMAFVSAVVPRIPCTSANTSQLSRRWAPTPATGRLTKSNRTRTHAITTCCEQPLAATTATKEEIDNLFKRLTHVNKTLRKKASYQISELATEQEIERLLQLLTIEDTAHRRQAVQTLGMIGISTIHPLINLLTTSDNLTVRASCVKALASISLFYPDQRETFSKDALLILQSILLNKVNSDPVTRLSTVGCLGNLGCDSKDGSDHIYKGNEFAVHILMEACTSKCDMAIGTTIVSALAQIAQNGNEQRKQTIVNALKDISLLTNDEDDDDSALKYVQEIAEGQLNQLNNQTT